MDSKRFEEILKTTERANIDFKKEVYDFSKTKDVTAEFIKDIISLTNTIREHTAYIFFGISEEDKPTAIGINKSLDDAILQSKIKDKVNIIPQFSYYQFEFKSKIIGVIEIPIKKYSSAIFPIVNLKGLNKKIVYHRRGTSNSEAEPHEIVEIFNWIKEEKKIVSLPEYLSKINSGNYRLSEMIAEGLKLAIDNNIVELKEFCSNELKGYTNVENENKFPHRVIIGALCYATIKSLNYHSSTNINEVYTDLLNNQICLGEDKFLKGEPISVIEDDYDKIEKEDFKGLLNIEISSNSLEIDIEERPIYIYFKHTDIIELIKSTKEKLVEIILKYI